MGNKANQHKTSHTEFTSVDVFLGVLIVCGVLVLGGLYVWGALLSTEDTAKQHNMSDQSVAALSTGTEQTPNDHSPDTTRASDELEDIERDLNRASLDVADMFRDFDEMVGSTTGIRE